jgi:hypothetical protein
MEHELTPRVQVPQAPCSTVGAGAEEEMLEIFFATLDGDKRPQNFCKDDKTNHPPANGAYTITPTP